MAKERLDPLALFDQLYTAGKEIGETVRAEFGTDPVRAQRDAERRERLGRLRAREHPGKRPNGLVHLFFG